MCPHNFSGGGLADILNIHTIKFVNSVWGGAGGIAASGGRSVPLNQFWDASMTRSVDRSARSKGRDRNSEQQVGSTVVGGGPTNFSGRDSEGGDLSTDPGNLWDAVQVSDQAILGFMRTVTAASILDLAERLGVTDTAVRQRLTRLMDRGLVERFAVREGRGRPKHVYRLTESGQRASGANLEDLAVVLWMEVASLSDEVLRDRLMQGVIDRLVALYLPEVVGTSVEQRLRSVVELLNRRGIPFAFERLDHDLSGTTPDGDETYVAGRLVVLGCPYPGLKDQSRWVCRMEQQLFQRLVGVPLVDVTQPHGGGCCSFVPAAGVSLRKSAPGEDGHGANECGTGGQLPWDSMSPGIGSPGVGNCGGGNCGCKTNPTAVPFSQHRSSSGS